MISKKIKTSDNHTISYFLMLFNTLFVGMTGSLKPNSTIYISNIYTINLFADSPNRTLKPIKTSLEQMVLSIT